MKEIEQQVQLPKGAWPMEEYARHYAPAADGKVVGIYVLRTPPLPRGPDYGCEEVVIEGEDVTSKPVPCPPEPDESQQVGAGERRWFDDDDTLPVIFDGGCSVVHVTFNPATRRIEEAFCNGRA